MKKNGKLYLFVSILDKLMLYFQSVWKNALSHLVFKLIKTVSMQQKQNAWFPSLEFQCCIYSLKKSDFQRNVCSFKSKVPFASQQRASDLGTEPNCLPVQSPTCLGSRNISESWKMNRGNSYLEAIRGYTDRITPQWENYLCSMKVRS